MTVIQGYTADRDDDSLSNCLLIENAENVLPDKVTGIPVVRIETNYKPSAELGRPVHLTLAAALDAAARVVSHTQNSLENFDVAGFTEVIDDDMLLDMLHALTSVDGAVYELRQYLQDEMGARRDQRTGQPSGGALPAPDVRLAGIALDQLDVAFVPHAIAALKRVERKQVPYNGDPMPWWPLEVDGVKAAYVVSMLNHPLQVIAAHAEMLTAPLPERQGNLTGVVGNLRERVEQLCQYASGLAAQPTAEDLEGLRSLAEFVHSGVCVLASALPSSVTITDNPTDTPKGQN